VTQLVEVIDHIGSPLDTGKQTDLIYLDMSKAFDKVQHSLILDKLRKYNICGNMLNWFTSYLRERRQRVTVLGETSKECKVTSGVPQGSILGPILFLLYVNDLPKAIKSSKVACFANDTKVLKQIDNLQDTVRLQTDINNLNSWAKDNGLTFNQTK
jgi:retron-type reverse transcriptase